MSLVKRRASGCHRICFTTFMQEFDLEFRVLFLQVVFILVMSGWVPRGVNPGAHISLIFPNVPHPLSPCDLPPISPKDMNLCALCGVWWYLVNLPSWLTLFTHPHVPPLYEPQRCESLCICTSPNLGFCAVCTGNTVGILVGLDHHGRFLLAFRLPKRDS